MSGLYVHIPFCESKCGYCDFYSIKRYKDSDFAADFITSVVDEITQKAYLFKNQTVDTVYFGGGTPSILPLKHLERIFRASPTITIFPHPSLLAPRSSLLIPLSSLLVPRLNVHWKSILSTQPTNISLIYNDLALSIVLVQAFKR